MRTSTRGSRRSVAYVGTIGVVVALLVAAAGIPAVATAPPQAPLAQDDELDISAIAGGPGKPSTRFLDSRLSQLEEIERREGMVAARRFAEDNAIALDQHLHREPAWVLQLLHSRRREARRDERRRLDLLGGTVVLDQRIARRHQHAFDSSQQAIARIDVPRPSIADQYRLGLQDLVDLDQVVLDQTAARLDDLDDRVDEP